MTPKQLKNVLRLSAHERYEYAISEIVESGLAWGLFSEGWTLLGDDDGLRVLPLWPTEDFAVLAATREWSEYRPRSISLETLLGELLPMLERDQVQVAVFPHAGKGLILEPSELIGDLKETMAAE